MFRLIIFLTIISLNGCSITYHSSQKNYSYCNNDNDWILGYPIFDTLISAGLSSAILASELDETKNRDKESIRVSLSLMLMAYGTSAVLGYFAYAHCQSKE